MNPTTPQQIMQRWQIVQGQLLSDLRQDIGSLTPKLEKLIHILEWSRIEEFVQHSLYHIGRSPHELAWLANSFVANTVLGLTTTVHIIERLSIDKALQRICGFPLDKKLPSASTLSRAFEAFAKDKLAESNPHEALIKAYFGDRLIDISAEMGRLLR
ncbi:IS1182 family transposase ISUnCu17 [Celerinatantimonas diazotrophica]|nr:IS1182 family transposase ISUnCu17 [Celerinatantimonas diazotrophica]